MDEETDSDGGTYEGKEEEEEEDEREEVNDEEKHGRADHARKCVCR